MKTLKRITTMILILITILTMVSCGKEAIEEVIVEKPSFETQIVEDNDFTYEIPASWAKVEQEGLATGQVLYAPSSEELKKGTAKVDTLIIKSNRKSPSLEEFNKQADTTLKPAIQKAFSNGATDFKYSDFKAPIGDIFTMEYTVTVSGIIMKQTQYYLLVNDYTIVITSTDIDDDASPSAVEVAKYIASSIKKK